MVLPTFGLYAHTEKSSNGMFRGPVVVDSTLEVARESKLVLTGTITELNSNKPIQGALISADFLKHYHSSDDNGNNISRASFRLRPENPITSWRRFRMARRSPLFRK